ncbi:uncharacterized protein LOC114742276 [Neltuma alba]|uniref:uncharacterized protein LOC114742276 n=1 Tax=Neltuma alba TaxID=207710 RepID=UPI0010A2D683|nr:uncharacterized protein LOC114742276 [Prosopis alba]
MIWNSRGTGTKTFPSLVQELKKHFCLDFLALLETRSDKLKTERRIGSLGFQEYTFIEAEGYSGGIWCLWNAGVRRVEVLERHRQYLHLYIETSRLEQWFMTIVYASPHVMGRHNLWNALQQLESGIHGPWLLGGDFNATIFQKERRTTAVNGLSTDREFSNWYETSGVSDLGHVGPLFTWKRGNTEARLDRVLANDEWCRLFPNARVSHLPFYKSDHRPLLVQLDFITERPKRPFRFIAAWVLHDDFKRFVTDNWKTEREWKQNLHQFTHECCRWNKNVFGHIEGRKNKLLRRMDGVNKALERGRNKGHYEDLLAQLWKDFEEVLVQESLLWAQKARVEWSVYGDRNTRLFHSRANKRRKANRIDAIRIDGGEWCHDLEVIKQEATRFFASLFTEEARVRAELPCELTYPTIDEVSLQICDRPIDAVEIKNALLVWGP